MDMIIQGLVSMKCNHRMAFSHGTSSHTLRRDPVA
jgi:hypothetical protein